MSNEPRWLIDIDRKIGKLSIDFNALLRELRQSLERVRELEEENDRLHREITKLLKTDPGPAISQLALPRHEKPKRKEQDDAEH